MSSILQGSALGLVFIIFAGWRRGRFRKFAGDTGLNDAVDTQSSIERRDPIQRDFGRVERWTHANFMIRPSAESCVWVMAILNVDTGWAVSELRGLGCAGG